jgi:hypothetical protein
MGYPLATMLTKDAVSHFGTKIAVARALNIGKAAVSKWDEEGLVPPLRAAQLHKLTRGKLKFDPSAYADWNRPHEAA